MSAIIHQIHQRRAGTRIPPTTETRRDQHSLDAKIPPQRGSVSFRCGWKSPLCPNTGAVFAAGQMACVSASAVKPFFRFIHIRVPYSGIPPRGLRGAWLKERGI